MTEHADHTEVRIVRTTDPDSGRTEHSFLPVRSFEEDDEPVVIRPAPGFTIPSRVNGHTCDIEDIPHRRVWDSYRVYATSLTETINGIRHQVCHAHHYGDQPVSYPGAAWGSERCHSCEHTIRHHDRTNGCTSHIAVTAQGIPAPCPCSVTWDTPPTTHQPRSRPTSYLYPELSDTAHQALTNDRDPTHAIDYIGRLMTRTGSGPALVEQAATALADSPSPHSEHCALIAIYSSRLTDFGHPPRPDAAERLADLIRYTTRPLPDPEANIGPAAARYASYTPDVVLALAAAHALSKENP